MLEWKSKNKQIHLLALPAEIRNLIYEYTVSESAPLVTYCLSQYEKESYTEATQPVLTRVNRQLRNESLPLFYECNDFVLHTEGPKASDTRRWLVCNAPYLQDMKRLSVWLRYCALPQARTSAQGAMSFSVQRPHKNEPWIVEEGWKWVTVCKRPSGLEADVGFLIDKLKDMVPALCDEKAGPEHYMGLVMDLRMLYVQEKNA